jgi:NAD(P)-dependent dehydrogenase (short-subunit alcohol dehydrogenase family)
MELSAGKVAVVTGAGSGIGFALANRFARSGLNIVLADVDQAALDEAAAKIGANGVETHAIVTDVSDEAAVNALAASTMDRFGAVHVVCNNAGVAGRADAWFGPLSNWTWVLGVNLMGVVYGIRAFLPHLVASGGGHVVNTASIAGVLPGFSPAYDASKHGVVAISEDLYNMMNMLGLPIGVSVLCPGWVRTNILDADRNWPAELGDKPVVPEQARYIERHVRRAIDEGAQPAEVADKVADAVETGRFWIFPQRDFLELAIRRWEAIGEELDPIVPEQVPGMPPRAQLEEEMRAMMAQMVPPA